MKVLVVTNMYPKPGHPHAGSFIKSQMDSIRHQGIDMEIININERSGLTKFIHAWFKIFKKSFDPSFDLIHAHYGYSGIISALQWKLPLLVSFCGGDVLGNPNRKGKVSFIDLLFLPLGWCLSIFAGAVIVKSREMKRKLPFKKHLYVIPNGVDFDFFKPLDMKVARKKLGLSQDRKYILFPANPDWIRKAYPIARDAVQLVNMNSNEVELLVVHSMSQEIIPLYMNACDVLIFTSLWEGSPNVIKEAMACNLPIISVNVGDVNDVIKNCKNCKLINRSAEDAAMELEIILSKSERSNGRELIAHLEINTIAKKIINIYQSIIR